MFPDHCRVECHAPSRYPEAHMSSPERDVGIVLLTTRLYITSNGGIIRYKRCIKSLKSVANAH